MGSDNYETNERDSVVVEISHDAVRALRLAVRDRDTTVPRLVRDLIEVVAADNLIAAVLDDSRWLRSGRRVRVVAGDKVRLEMTPYDASKGNFSD
jgi:hypothetical protein